MSSRFSDALKNMRRSPYQTVSATLVLAQTFFIGYTLALLLIASHIILTYFESQPQVTAFFNPDVPDAQVQMVQAELAAKPYVKQVELVSKEQALEIYREENKDDPLLLQLVTADILPASLEVSTDTVESLPQIEADLKNLEGIDEVVFQKDVVDQLTSWTSSLRIIGLGLITVMSITSFILIMVILGMKISAKRHAISIMQLLGASKWYVKSPFVFEGIMYGILGSLLGWAATYIGLLYLTPWLLQFLAGIPLLPVSPVFMASLLGVGTVGGILLGSFSSLIVTGRFLK